ncbi:hypothetical protein [Frondihabitans sp. Leaf304]|uniref:hypothetical protein n=1 Tax=Frondihabitans sp. Leaf304 TaxID=1736329 RepID=UPI0006FF4020|nr:hypothetical protein [Frondihabitans sp. Leaf304]KQQ28637.1 hypothetical protein ASF54_08300 [Frondihabitans sp. Leaf304]
MTSRSQQAPQGLPKLGIAVLMTFLMILGAVLMHTLMGHTAHSETMPGMTTSTTASSGMGTVEHSAGHAHSSHGAAAATGTVTSVLSNGVSDCGGLCAMICSLMGMACLMVLVLFAIAVLRGRTTRALYALSKLLAMAPIWARGVIPRPPVSLAALSVIRV